MEDIVLSCRSLTLGYDEDTPLLNGIDLTVKKGQTILITGRNGSGKTTLLRTLARRHQRATLKLVGGKIEIRKDCTVSILAQRPNTQLLTHTVKEEVATPFNFQGMERAKRKRLVDRALKRFEISDLKNIDPEKLSSGQKQMVNCAAVSQVGSQVLLLDEPFAVLDRHNSALLRSMMVKLKEEGTSLIIVDHSPTPEILKIVDERFVLQEGRLQKIGEEDLRDETRIQELPEIPFSRKNKIDSRIDLLIGRETPLSKFVVSKETHTVILEGLNGSGKTTCLLTLLGSLHPLEGSIPKKFKSKKKVFVPQDSIGFFRKPTVREEAEFRGIDSSELDGIGKWLDKPIYTLSEGEKKWVTLVMAFKSNAEILLLDEPTFALDNQHIEQFYNLLINSPKVIILATHNETLIRWGRSGHEGIETINFMKFESEGLSKDEFTKKTTFHPLSLLLFMVFVLFTLMQGSWKSLLTLFAFSTIFYSWNNGIRKTLALIWDLRYLVLLSVLVHSFLLFTTQSFSYISEIHFALRILTLFISVNIFGSNTNPDETIDFLMKGRFPPSIAWAIGTSAKQARFFVLELMNFIYIHRPTGRRGIKWIKDQSTFAIDLLAAAYNAAIDRSINMADSLLNRGWKGPHKTIICYTSNLRSTDLIFSAFLTGLIVLFSVLL